MNQSQPPSLWDTLQVSEGVVSGTLLSGIRHDPRPHRLHGVRHKAILATTARCGGGLVSVALERFGLAFAEYFSTGGYMAEWLAGDTSKTLQDLADHLADAQSPGDRFSVKLPYPGVAYLYLLGELPERIGEWSVVFLRRRNLVRQAVSSRIAALSGQWTSAMSPGRAVADSDYDFGAICSAIDVFSGENARWERLFALCNIAPLRLWYEDFVSDVGGGCETIARFLGIDPTRFPLHDGHRPWIEAQATGLNDVWEERFRRDVKIWLASSAAFARE